MEEVTTLGRAVGGFRMEEWESSRSGLPVVVPASHENRQVHAFRRLRASRVTPLYHPGRKFHCLEIMYNIHFRA